MSGLGGGSTANLAWNLGTSQQYGVNVAGAWAKYSGAGVKVGVFDDGIVADAALQAALGASAAVSSVTDGSYGKHGTAVAGLVAGAGGIGVAAGASLLSVAVIGQSNAAIGAAMGQAAGFDVTNSSFGWESALYVDRASGSWANLFGGIANAADHGRGGLGTVQVVAAGNYRATGGDTNLSNFTNDRHVITVGAVTSDGKVAAYSSPGASLLVVAPSSGGSKTLTTTDLPGTAGYGSTDLTTAFGGTSAATPEVAGVVALMLEANHGLGWRDVGTILAATAVQLPGSGAVTNAGSHWNGGGMAFSDDTGFGLVNASAAVRLAETWSTQSTSANEVTLTASAGGTQTLTAGRTVSYGFDVAKAVGIESVEVTLQGNQGKVGDLTVELVSASGTVSTLLKAEGGTAAFTGFTFETNAFLGEHADGHWTLRVTDASSGGTGTYTGATLAIHGGAATDHLFVFTDQYGGLAGRDTITDTSGQGILNAAATTSDNTIDLHPGATSTIAGKALHISAGSSFSTAIGGAGNDLLVANDSGSWLAGGDGNDTFWGGAGNDTFVLGAGVNGADGGAGLDRAILSGSASAWSIARDADGTLHLASGATSDTLVRVERVAFDDHVLAFDGAATDAYKLYGAALDRTPDTAGLGYWVAQIDTGASLKSVADYFANSPEFHARYGDAISSAQYITALYENTLHRDPDATGQAFWTDALDHGTIDRAEALLEFSASQEYTAHVAAQIAHGIAIA